MFVAPSPKKAKRYAGFFAQLECERGRRLPVGRPRRRHSRPSSRASRRTGASSASAFYFVRLHVLLSSGSLCSGAILDATHVLTAAHCVVENGAPVPASTLTVRAGVTNAASPSPTDSVQDRGGREPARPRRLRPGREDRRGRRRGAHAHPPLDLNGPTARAIALPSASTALEFGDSVTLAGFGLKDDNGTIDGTLNGMNGTLVDQSECLPPAYDTANGVLLCAFSGSSSPCSGDSGGGARPGRARRRSWSASRARLVQQQLRRVVRERDCARDPRVHPRQRQPAHGAAADDHDHARAPDADHAGRPDRHCVPGALERRAGALVRVPRGRERQPSLRPGRLPTYKLRTSTRAAGCSAACSRRTPAARRSTSRLPTVVAGRERARRSSSRPRRRRAAAPATSACSSSTGCGPSARSTSASRSRRASAARSAARATPAGSIADGGHAAEGEGDGAARRPRPRVGDRKRRRRTHGEQPPRSS